jgi:hypothetical protein
MELYLNSPIAWSLIKHRDNFKAVREVEYVYITKQVGDERRNMWRNFREVFMTGIGRNIRVMKKHSLQFFV